MVALRIKELPIAWAFNHPEENEIEWGWGSDEERINSYSFLLNPGRQCILPIWLTQWELSFLFIHNHLVSSAEGNLCCNTHLWVLMLTSVTEKRKELWLNVVKHRNSGHESPGASSSQSLTLWRAELNPHIPAHTQVSHKTTIHLNESDHMLVSLWQYDGILSVLLIREIVSKSHHAKRKLD